MNRKILLVTLILFSFSLFAFAGSECQDDPHIGECIEFIKHDVNTFLTCIVKSGNIGSGCKNKANAAMNHPRYDQCSSLSAAGSDNPFEKCLSAG